MDKIEILANLITSKIFRPEETSKVVIMGSADDLTNLAIKIRQLNEDDEYETLQTWAEVNLVTNEYVYRRGYNPNLPVPIETISKQLSDAIEMILNKSIKDDLDIILNLSHK